MHITAFLSFSAFSEREAHWQGGMRIKDLIPVNHAFQGGRGRKKGEEADRNER
jgi:hypothetical protein